MTTCKACLVKKQYRNKECIPFVLYMPPLREIPGIPRDLNGWGNGYVAIPKGHPLYGKAYDDIDVEVQCGLTYAEKVGNLQMGGIVGEYWVIGFDTKHWGDNLTNRSKENVVKETLSLKLQIDSYL